ncbi:heavy metal translocating P-type ATPase [Treponema sp.]|uniref:heavy metal translocating P-type ATPase n=1 Tax=Treponema sp. TaxID=166 RepID=UPI00298D8805|nr:heavy metal translocating P-type ATPase [Treponema sp.]MCR5612787.1 heavy metal translocating P-type ATPase [Treponema sp.]
MNFTVKHSLPGRLRIRYDKTKITRRQAALAYSLLSVQEGMTDVSVNYITGSFLIYYDIKKLSEKHIKAYFMALSDKYLKNQEMLEAVEEPQDQDSLLFDLAFMTFFHYFKQVLPLPIRLIFRVASLGPRILKGLEQVVKGNVFKSEVLDAAAISMSLITGDYKTASNINFLLNIGDTIEDFTKKKSYSDLASRLLSQNDQVQLVEKKADGKMTEKSVPLSLVKKGDVVAVRTGNVIPVDGNVLRGEGLVNQASITGEPLAVEKREGSSVFAGTIVQEGELFVEVRAVGSQTKVQNILSMIDNSQSLKVSSQVRSEHLADSLVKYNFLLSLGVFLFTRNLSKVMATLMVDYSCAMKLASPIAVLSAMKEAAENGIIVKGGKFLEDASLADTVVFDKTGTLTAATPELSRVITFGERKEDEVLAIAACLEEHFAHPVAAAIVNAAQVRNIIHPEEHAKVEYIVAHGIATKLNGKKLVIGSAHFVFDDEKVNAPEGLNKIQQEALDNGESLLYLAEEKELIGIFAINDPVRKNAAAIIKKLHQSGIKNCVMITGDDEGAAKNAAKITKIDHYISRALPEDKFNYIEKQKKLGHKVIMIGDGINDAPALAAADTGIAMGDCADITGETADIVLSCEDGLDGLYKIRVLGKRLMEKIDTNNRGIVAVNTTFMMLGLLGIISPSIAAILHNVSTVAFSVNATKPLLVEMN